MVLKKAPGFYLVVKFEITKTGTTQKIEGEFMPMVANDGLHYGDNVKLFGPGKYHVKYTILPPSENKHAHFGRHTDRQTGVRPGSSRLTWNMTSASWASARKVGTKPCVVPCL